MNIFEKLNILLIESEGVSKVKESDIPIHPEMETKEQGKIAAAEKILKLFQKLSASSGGEEEVKDSKPEIPDDMIDPMMKKAPKPSKEKTFEKNKLTGWDEMSDEKIKKEVDVDDDDTTDDEFDDFDYRNNHFGDEDDMDETSDYDDDMSEDEKLKESIEDAIDSLTGDDDEGDDDDDEGDDDSGADWGDYDEGDDDSGADWGDDEEYPEPEPTGQQGGEQGGQQGGKQGGEQGGEQGGQQGGEQGASSKSSTKNSGKHDTKSEKRKRLEDLKKSLESDGTEEFDKKN
jgi:hypothetical protein